MTLNATQIVVGINAAEFTEAEWGNAMLVLKLQVQLGLKRAEISNLESWLGAKNAQFDAQLATLRGQETAIVEAINGLAPTP